ncbi:MAG: metal ABC transporter substrate-binding protein [Synergistaceae bacterium]|jgi:zinc transport system substrate-binding protein|nr:metal ABC transporter substrate-binding protein [Synergistaceae bacterium]
MKKWIAIALTAALLVVAVPACGWAADSGKKINIVTTIFPPYDFTREVAQDEAEITMLLRPGSETHSYEPTPQDIIKIQNCDVFIYVGGESDEWVKNVLKAIDAPKMQIVTLMDCVSVVEEEIVEGMQEEEEEEEEEEGHVHEEEYDEHVWTSPRNAKLIVQKISGTLCEVDAVNADAYKKNTAACLEKLDKLDAELKKVVDGAARKTLVFGDRFPFRYFADAYGLSYFAAFPGCSTETEASAATVAFLIDKVEAEKIPVVFHIELSNEKIADTICEATGAKNLLLHACHNISRDDFQKGATYLGLMTANIDALKQALY